ncbi:hypothetical protein LSAT2_031103, partial [Lamellibrachia satsuma]
LLGTRTTTLWRQLTAFGTADCVRDCWENQNRQPVVQSLQYIKLVGLFNFSTRTGNFALLLVCVEEMIPIFNAAVHFVYAKCARLYLQQAIRVKQELRAANVC